jgi:hypothetical protein
MAHASDSLLDFAAAVHEALPWVGAAPTERFGRRKVFVSALYAEMAKQAPYVPYSVGSLDAFKARLVDANREGLLSLARADLVAAMDPDAVAASEIRSLGSEFHFVIDPTAREPWEAASPAAYSAPPERPRRQLKRETLRLLEPLDLRQVAGGDNSAFCSKRVGASLCGGAALGCSGSPGC